MALPKTEQDKVTTDFEPTTEFGRRLKRVDKLDLGIQVKVLKYKPDESADSVTDISRRERVMRSAERVMRKHRATFAALAK